MTSSEMLSKIDLRELSDEELIRLSVYMTAEQDRRTRKREKQAVKDAMNTEPKT